MLNGTSRQLTSQFYYLGRDTRYVAVSCPTAVDGEEILLLWTSAEEAEASPFNRRNKHRAIPFDFMDDGLQHIEHLAVIEGDKYTLLF